MKNLNFKSMAAIAALLFICVLSIFEKDLFGIPPVVDYEGVMPHAKISVHAVDVDQGAASLIKTDEYNILIDTGEEAFSKNICDYLKGEKVDELDYIFITHPHTDHYGAAIDIMKNVKIKKAVLPLFDRSILKDNGLWDRMLSCFKEKGTEIIYPLEKEKYDLGNDVTLELLGPFLNEPKKINDLSLTFKITCKDVSFLITGDGEKAVEEALLKENIEADVLFSGHHGSRTSANEFFINKVRPQVSLVSVGMGNPHGLPDRVHIDNLLKYGDVYRTDLDGSVVFLSDGREIRVVSENERKR